MEMRAKRSGRPRSFDRNEALNRAMLAFWRSGYETTSVADLTATMGLTAPSLYAAFGNKEQLFLEGVRLYAGDPADTDRAVAEAASAKAAAQALLTGAAARFTGADTPAGCMLASATATGSDASAAVRRAVADVRARLNAALRARTQRDIAAGALPAGTDAGALADMTLAVLQGLSTLARDGVPRARLLAVVEATMRGWP